MEHLRVVARQMVNYVNLVEITLKESSIIGKEKIGEFESASIRDVFLEKATAEYDVFENDDWFTKVWMDGKSYIGSIVGEKIAYLDGNKIMVR